MALSSIRFYVYAYFRPDGRPLYIGKGQTKRWRSHLVDAQKIAQGGAWPTRCNKKFLRIIIKAIRAGHDIPVVKLQVDLTSAEAVRNERALIAVIGREAHGGPLVNLTDGGEGTEGHRHSSETRAKIGNAIRGRVHSIEETAARSRSQKGRPKPPGFGDKIAAVRRGIPHSAERRANISAAKLGKKLSPSGRAKRIEVMAREKIRAKLRAANLGKKATPEVRAKMSATHRAIWSERRAQ